MDQQQLREHLDELNAAINDLDATEADKAKLADLITDIERQLAEPLLEGDQPGLAEQVDGMISSFEADHPVVAGILNRIMVTLSSMGV